MTNEEKAKRLEDMALIPVFLDRQDEALLREAAAHFRSLVPNEGGWLRCRVCFVAGQILKFGAVGAAVAVCFRTI